MINPDGGVARTGDPAIARGRLDLGKVDRRGLRGESDRLDAERRAIGDVAGRGLRGSRSGSGQDQEPDETDREQPAQARSPQSHRESNLEN